MMRFAWVDRDRDAIVLAGQSAHPGSERSRPQHVELDDLEGEQVQLTMGQPIDVFVTAYRAPPDRGETGIVYSLRY